MVQMEFTDMKINPLSPKIGNVGILYSILNIDLDKLKNIINNFPIQAKLSDSEIRRCGFTNGIIFSLISIPLAFIPGIDISISLAAGIAPLIGGAIGFGSE